MAAWQRYWLLRLGCLTALCFGCASPPDIGSPSPPTGGLGGGSGSAGSESTSSTSGSGAASGGSGNATPDACAVTSPLPGRVRRLTRLEVQNTLTDLLGPDAGALALELEADNGATKFSTAADRSVSAAYVTGLKRLAGLAAAYLDPEKVGPALDPACALDDMTAAACATGFIRSFGERAWRRPLTEEEVDQLLDVYEAGTTVVLADADAPAQHRAGVEYVVRALLQASSFMFRAELGPELPTNTGPAPTPLTSEEAAAALSYGLLASPPDEGLRAWAASGAAPTREALLAQGRRLLESYPARAARQGEAFVREWLGIDLSSPAWQKDLTRYPEATPELRKALDRETTLLLQDWASHASLLELLTAPVGYVSQTTAWLYGVPEDSPLFVSGAPEFTRIEVNPKERAGILTLPSVMGSWARPAESSPVRRGVAVMRKLLCREPPPVPPSVPPLAANSEVEPLTTRARFERHTSDPGCAACHRSFDPMGFAFEHYDAVGAYRATENEVPVDSQGALSDSRGTATEVPDAIALAGLLAASEDVHACVVRQVQRFTSGRRETDADTCALAAQTQRFEREGMNVQELMLQQVVVDASTPRARTEPQ